MKPGSAELALLGGLSTSRVPIPATELLRIVSEAGIEEREASRALGGLASRGLIDARGGRVELTPDGITALLDVHAEIAAALDPSPRRAVEEECPSVPWLTTVQTCWIDAVSLNYAVDPEVLSGLLPEPLRPEIWKGSGWVQILMSSLRDMRPQGLPALFGVRFYQVSYRAAVTYRSGDGTQKRGGYFVKSETNHPVMRAVGNRLTEFKFHEFGEAEMVMVRDGDLLTLGVDPASGSGARIVTILDTQPLAGPPPGSVWSSVEELFEPLIECYDAYGVDRAGRWLYILTIDRDPWRAHFVAPKELYVEWAESGPLQGKARLDSVLHVKECPYRWRPLRRERIP